MAYPTSVSQSDPLFHKQDSGNWNHDDVTIIYGVGEIPLSKFMENRF
jgi:hypothetical protein